ncbi:MAG: hypothetical protein ACE5H5_05100 [Nitrospinota bacterium]
MGYTCRICHGPLDPAADTCPHCDSNIGATGREITIEVLEEVAVLEEMGLRLTDEQRQFLADLWVMTMEESPVEIEGLEIAFPGGCTIRFRAKGEEETF